MENSKRNHGIELLRILLMYMVCILHILNHGGVLDNTLLPNKYSVFFIEKLCICAVDGFGLISGYFAQDKPAKYQRIIRLWLVALFYSAGISIGVNLLSVFGLTTRISTLDVAHCFMPTSFGPWYFSAYFLVFFLSPFINKAIANYEKEKCKNMLIILFLVFSCKTLIHDVFFNKGYSALWLLVLYIIGALIKKLTCLQMLIVGN